MKLKASKIALVDFCQKHIATNCFKNDRVLKILTGFNQILPKGVNFNIVLLMKSVDNDMICLAGKYQQTG